MILATFWTSVLGVVAFILILSLIVLIHEGGHFIFARRAGILCYEFSIGMGPLIWSKKIGETMYSIRAIPIGGYVSMAGEEVESDPLLGCDECQFILKNGKVKQIIIDKKSHQYDDLDIYKVIKYDLIGTKEETPGELFLTVESEDGVQTTYEVLPNAAITYTKKQTLQIATYNRNFSNKTVGQRFLSVFAGPMMNFVLAIVLFFIIGLVQGYPDASITTISNVEKNTPAYNAGLRDGDTILYIGNETDVPESMYFDEWADISYALDNISKGNIKGYEYQGFVNVIYKRGETIHTTKAYPYVFIQGIQLALQVNDNNNDLIVGEYLNNNKDSLAYKAGLRKGDRIVSVDGQKLADRQALLAYFNSADSQEDFTYEIEYVKEGASSVTKTTIDGYSNNVLIDQGGTPTKVQLYITAEYKTNVVKLLYMPFVQTGDAALLIFRTLGALITDKSVGISDLSGPIGILDATVKITSQGTLSLVSWAAIISVNLGFMNILPVPALDGGRLAFIAYEAITKKKPSPKVENRIHTIGFVILMIFFVFVSLGDVIKLIFK